jgi:hypothetical protein
MASPDTSGASTAPRAIRAEVCPAEARGANRVTVLLMVRVLVSSTGKVSRLAQQHPEDAGHPGLHDFSNV